MGLNDGFDKKEEIPEKIIFEKITRENISELLCDDNDMSVIAISFAEIGAMGSSGEVNIVIRNEKWELKGYTTNYAFGIFEEKSSFNGWRDEQEILFNYIPVLREINFNGFVDGEYHCPIRGSSDYDIWEIIDMGFGNHLIASCMLGVELRRAYKFARVGKLYSEWKQFIEQYAHQIRNRPSLDDDSTDCN